MRTIGTSVYGLRCPIFKQGDDLVKIVSDIVLNCGKELNDRDIIAITESVVARAEGNYVSIDEVAEEIKQKSNNADMIIVYKPIYSRNRFAMILKAIARASRKKVCIVMPDVDYVGNDLNNHPFTGLNYDEYYKSIVEAEGKECEISEFHNFSHKRENVFILDCQQFKASYFYGDADLSEICSNKCEYGLYGSNKATEETLKLFPSLLYSNNIVNGIQQRLKEQTGKTVEVMVYGDGCFKDPVGGIWEFADPVVSPAFTSGLNGTPNEIKLKYLADNNHNDLSGEDLSDAIKEDIKTKENNMVGQMKSQGTTPRRITDLVGSLCDLVSGSGDKGTPVVLIQGYFDNFASE